MPRPVSLRDRAGVWYLVSYLLDDASERLVWSRWDAASRAGRALGHLSDLAARRSMPPAGRVIDLDAPVSVEATAFLAEMRADGFAE